MRHAPNRLADVLLVPNLWGHATVNLEPCIGYATEFAFDRSFDLDLDESGQTGEWWRVRGGRAPGPKGVTAAAWATAGVTAMRTAGSTTTAGATAAAGSASAGAKSRAVELEVQLSSNTHEQVAAKAHNESGTCEDDEIDDVELEKLLDDD